MLIFCKIISFFAPQKYQNLLFFFSYLSYKHRDCWNIRLLNITWNSRSFYRLYLFENNEYGYLFMIGVLIDLSEDTLAIAGSIIVVVSSLVITVLIFCCRRKCTCCNNDDEESESTSTQCHSHFNCCNTGSDSTDTGKGNAKIYLYSRILLILRYTIS